MSDGVIFFLVPTLLFVIAFLYETWLSFKRLAGAKHGRSGYVQSTWEITHTLLVMGVVFLVMMYTQDLTALASAIIWVLMLAAVALGLRAILYVYIFYVRRPQKINWIDWAFAFSHVLAAALLIGVVVKALSFIYTNKPVANTQFFPYFIPGLIVTVAICIVPMTVVYLGKDSK